MKKKNQLLSALALSVGLSLSASFPAFAALPSQVPGQHHRGGTGVDDDVVAGLYQLRGARADAVLQRQVQGILSGITGAAGYESLTQSSGTASLLRSSYQYGMLLTALLILVGSLITGIITSITRGKAEKEA